jgi:hypothetical protein
VADTSEIVAPTGTATATQAGAANLAVTVRIDSPGDNGDVTQTIDGQAESGQTATENAPQAASSQTDATQVAPTNVAVSVRVGSPGTDGQVTQTIVTDGSAQGQYQLPATQYQDGAPVGAPAPAVDASAPAPDAPVAQAPAATQPPQGTTDAPSLPSSWVWNWTWTCGDITGSDTTQTIDTGIPGWIWTWNIDMNCATPAASPPPSLSISPPESSGFISPISPTSPDVVPPDPPQVTPPQPPEPPVVAPPEPPVVLPPVPPAEVAAPSVPPEAVAQASPPGTTLELAPILRSGIARPSAGRLEGHHQSAPLLWMAVDASTTVAASPRTRERDRTATRASAKDTQPLQVLSFPPLPMSGGGNGGAPGGGSGVVAALATWLLLQLPGLAVLRLPPSRRIPRARVDEILSRPG